MGFFSSPDKAGSLQREQDRQLQRARDARAAGFDGTADKALERAEEIGRQVDAAQEGAGAAAWWSRAHP
jgi:hypothetical protein